MKNDKIDKIFEEEGIEVVDLEDLADAIFEASKEALYHMSIGHLLVTLSPCLERRALKAVAKMTGADPEAAKSLAALSFTEEVKLFILSHVSSFVDKMSDRFKHLSPDSDGMMWTHISYEMMQDLAEMLEDPDQIKSAVDTLTDWRKYQISLSKDMLRILEQAVRLGSEVPAFLVGREGNA